MPDKPARPCPHPGCGVLTTGGRCDKHKKQKWKENRSDNAIYNNTRWVKFRAMWLRRHPLCGDRESVRSPEHSICTESGRAVAATVVDHIKPHRGDLSLVYDEANLQSLCKDCHDRKTGQEMRVFQTSGATTTMDRTVSVEESERVVEALAPAPEPTPVIAVAPATANSMKEVLSRVRGSR